MNRISRTISGLRQDGLKAFIEIFIIKVKSFFEIFFPGTIWGERVGLKSVKSSLTDAEVEQIYDWSRDEQILRWTGGARSELSLDEFREQVRCERWRSQSGQRLFYIVTKDDGIIGRVGLFTIDWAKHEGEFGISIDKKFWNKQYGRDSTNLFIQYIFAKTPIRRIYLGTFQDNLRAQRSFAASGFRVTGSISRYLPSEGRQVDGIKMEITAQDLMKQIEQERIMEK